MYVGFDAPTLGPGRAEHYCLLLAVVLELMLMLTRSPDRAHRVMCPMWRCVCAQGLHIIIVVAILTRAQTLSWVSVLTCPRRYLECQGS